MTPGSSGSYPLREQLSTYAATPGRRAARASHQTAAERANAATNPYVGRRVAGRSIDAPSRTLGELSLGVLTLDRPGQTAPSRTVGRPDLLDTGTINRVLVGLESVDHSTSFADEATEALPLPILVPGTPGKRRAVRHAGRRGPLFRRLPSAPLLLGIAALAISAGGAVTLGGDGGTDLVRAEPSRVTQANALTGVGGIGSVGTQRSASPTSRASDRGTLAQGAGGQATNPVEVKAVARSGSIRALATQAENFSAVIKSNQWQAPLDSYRLTARFGEYGLWANYHTGLDFAAPDGTPIKAIAGGVVTSAAYDGSYGNKTVITLDDGTEIWYCHQSRLGVSVGDVVRSGDTMGYVGATGNVTGPHVHIEVRPGGGDPVDPYAAFVENGVQP